MSPKNKASAQEREAAAVIMQLGSLGVGLSALVLFACFSARHIAIVAAPVAAAVGVALFTFYFRSFLPASRRRDECGEKFQHAFSRLMMLAAFYPGAIALITAFVLASFRVRK